MYSKDVQYRCKYRLYLYYISVFQGGGQDLSDPPVPWEGRGRQADPRPGVHLREEDQPEPGQGEEDSMNIVAHIKLDRKLKNSKILNLTPVPLALVSKRTPHLSQLSWYLGVRFGRL